MEREKGKKRGGRRSTSRIKKLINKEEEFSRPALEPPFGLHPLRRSTVSRTLRVSANVPADTCCCVAPSAATSKRETEKPAGDKGTRTRARGNWRHSLDCPRRGADRRASPRTNSSDHLPPRGRYHRRTEQRIFPRYQLLSKLSRGGDIKRGRRRRGLWKLEGHKYQREIRRSRGCHAEASPRVCRGSC